MEKIIYHGSDHILSKPKFGYGKTYNDYGVGFYCTENPNMAKEWGVGIDHNGYANQYRIECDGLTILDLNAPGYTMLHWLTILLENREFDASAPLAAEAKEYLLKTFTSTISLPTSSLAIGQMTAIFPLHPILSTVRSLTVSYAMPCAWASWGNSSY